MLATQSSASAACALIARLTNQRYIGELVDLLSIPNVASDDVNIRRNAAKLIEMMSRRGIKTQLLEGGGPPSVFGELKTPGATRTIGLYAHYDGQPVTRRSGLRNLLSPCFGQGATEAGGSHP